MSPRRAPPVVVSVRKVPRGEGALYCRVDIACVGPGVQLMFPLTHGATELIPESTYLYTRELLETLQKQIQEQLAKEILGG